MPVVYGYNGSPGADTRLLERQCLMRAVLGAQVVQRFNGRGGYQLFLLAHYERWEQV